MPPLPLLPRQPPGSPDWYSPPDAAPLYNAGAASQAPGAPRQPSMTPAAAAALAARFPDLPQSLAGVLARKGELPEDIEATLEYLNIQLRLYQTASGLQKRQIEAQIEDAKRKLDNEIEIAHLQDRASRYGTDAQTQQALQDRIEKARQFDASHGLEMQRFGLDTQRFGLDVANSYTKYAQTYDDIWALQDFKGALGAVQSGGGPAPISGQPAPHAKTWQDWSALAGYNTPAVAAGQTQASGGGQPNMTSGGGGGTDPRLKAARAIGEAIPPSATPGLDESDWAAINAYKSLYLAGRPGDIEKLGAQRNRIGMAGLGRAGYNPALIEEERRRSLPGQGRASAA